MAHLLHIDSSIQGERSTSRKLTAQAAEVWRAAHPEGTVTYRDLGRRPLPHLDEAAFLARLAPVEQHTPDQAAAWQLTEQLVDEVKRADTVLLGMPLYNYSAPSSVKAWVDYLITPRLAYDPETGTGLLADKEFIVLASRGGGYGPGTPREGWDHAEPWLPHGLSVVGLRPRFITAELTLAQVNPAMSDLIPLAVESLAAAQREIDTLWRAGVPA
ncbi:FMN-dependent NADH-azoreductase [Acrocarpospora pleiomorpha]|uniref:FMN dependent NADH:quinone oxidoreductase n=1 Tax=Acrocarpospora pleiomorpha TaxID=90975 RepID=A0A5M3XEA0_9ACTN|nr:NAD(P)H-dependent oxidoreductase [Acrocarpospora pleiomorpha]GES18956.1 FMN-dependent NADH-azoreductase [Acrocarpospora pleiomorpha]